MIDDLISTFWPLYRVWVALTGGWYRFLDWWSGRAWRYQRELIAKDPIKPVTELFEQQINVLIGRPEQGAAAVTPAAPTLLDNELKWLSNTAVLATLKIGQQLTSADQKQIQAGLKALSQAIADTSRQRSQLETQLGSGSGAVRRPGRPRYLITYYGRVHGLLKVRQARALARLSPAQPDQIDDAFRAAQREQPGMLYIAKEYARYLGRRGRFDEADKILSGVRSGLTNAGRYELAAVRVELTRDYIETARAERRLRPLLARIKEDRQTLAECSAALNLESGTDDARVLLGWRALGASYQGDLHAELEELDLAARSYCDSLELYSEYDDIFSEMYLAEQIGNLNVRRGNLGLALSYYGRSVARWRDSGKPAGRTGEAKRAAGRLALGTMMTFDGSLPALDTADFANEDPGPFQTLTDLPNPLLEMPGMAERLRLGLDAQLRRGPEARTVYDILAARRTLMGAMPATGGFITQEDNVSAIQNWSVLVRLELDTSLLGLFVNSRSIEPVLLERAKRARLKVQDDWGIQLRGLHVADGPRGQRGYRILIRGHVVQQGVVPRQDALASLLPAVGSLINTGSPWPEGALAPGAEFVFEALETCLDRNMPLLVCHNELWWLLRKYELLPETGAASAERLNARSIVPLLDVVRRLVSKRVKPREAFPRIYARTRKGIAVGEPIDDIVADLLRMPELQVSAVQPQELSWGLLRPPVGGIEAAPEAANEPPVTRLDREAARRGLGEESKSKVRETAASAIGRREDIDYATELALDQFSTNGIILRASAINYLRVENWAATKQTDRLRNEVYAGTGVWLPRMSVQRGDELGAETCEVCFNDWHAAITVPPAATNDALCLGISQSLDARLAAFMGNRQLELLLHRLGSENQLLVSNLLERFPVPAILDELRRLLDARRSIGKLLDLAENMLLNQHRPEPERWALLYQAMPEFYVAV